MNKVKIFSHYEHVYELEKDINSFASQYKIVNVSLTCEKAGYTFYHFAAVVYEEQHYE